MMLPGWVGFIFPLHRKYGGLVDQSLSTLPLVVTDSLVIPYKASKCGTEFVVCT